jgi:hydroxymethylpyrimidine/phosphomethylpyrimidine kinase
VKRRGSGTRDQGPEKHSWATGPRSLAPGPAVCLTIAGSDSGGGAGIQADLKTFAALGVHGTSAITALTAQNTQGVATVHAVPVKHLAAELDAVFDDFDIAAVKTGMLGDARTVRCVARELGHRRPRWLVVDPVMIATSGARLLDKNAVRVLIDELIPLADVLTPNLPEAEALTGIAVRNARDGERVAAKLRAFGAQAVLLKGGHGRGRDVIDRWFDARGSFEVRNRRSPFDAHGTGCTLSAALAAELAKGRTPRTAARRAIAFVQRALQHAYTPGMTPLRVLAQRPR